MDVVDWCLLEGEEGVEVGVGDDVENYCVCIDVVKEQVGEKGGEDWYVQQFVELLYQVDDVVGVLVDGYQCDCCDDEDCGNEGVQLLYVG